MPSLKAAKKAAQATAAGHVKRWSRECKATVPRGELSRGGLTRGEGKACDHDLGCQAKDIPWGLVDEETGQLSRTFGRSAKTRDCIVEAGEARWYASAAHEPRAPARRQLTMANGPESSGVRTPFLHRMVQFADQIGNPLQLLDYPPYPSKDNPMERCWGGVERHWKGTLWRDGDPMLARAERMTWTGHPPIVELTHTEYPRGIPLGKKALRAVECRLERHPELPKWDLLIRPDTPD